MREQEGVGDRWSEEGEAPGTRGNSEWDLEPSAEQEIGTSACYLSFRGKCHPRKLEAMENRG